MTDLATPPIAAAEPAMTVGHLQFGYEPGQPVVSDLCVTLQPGRICALIGPNAAGKSTLLQLMLGQLKPWQGHVQIAGRDVTHLTAAERASLVSFVPQRSSARFAFTVEQVVEMGRFALTRDPAAIEQALTACDLLAVRQRVYAHLSVGQQQRVLLARAMAQATGHGRIMLLDEPGSAMDLQHVHQMMRQLQQIAQRGLAILVVLHDLNLCAHYADDVWLMDQGRLVTHGPWDRVLTSAVLEPVYHVRLQSLNAENGHRPVFCVATSDTLI